MTKILLIEDDDETAAEIAAELVHRGFEVECAATGIEGLDKARSCRPDAMIVDRLLPGMDGLTVVEALRQEQIRTPTLILSALGAVNDLVRGLRMRGDDYLTKPFAIVELLARIEALLRRPVESRCPRRRHRRCPGVRIRGGVTVHAQWSGHCRRLPGRDRGYRRGLLPRG